MIKNKKVKKLLDQNGLEIQNFSMINRLKIIINDLHQQISQQLVTIQNLKKDTKITKINQMEVQIQHLNDQNKRLILIIEDMKKTSKSQPENKNQQKMTSSAFKTASSKKSNQQSHFKKEQKEDAIKQMEKQKKFQVKYFQLLNDYQKLKKQMINLKVFEPTATKKRKSQNIIDKNCLILQKNVQLIEKISQQKSDLEAQNKLLKAKLVKLQQKINDLGVQNESYRKTCLELSQQLNRMNNLREKQNIKISQIKDSQILLEKHQNDSENRLSLKC